MQGPAWVSLLRRIPTELHDSLIFVLTTGTEVVLQTILRLERDFALVRCRMAGTQDSGRVVALPFDQINFLTVNKKMTEVEAQNLLGKAQPLPGLEPEPAAAGEPLIHEVLDENFLPVPSAAAPSGGSPVASASANGTPAENEAPAAKPGQVSKSILLARLRARLAKDGPPK